VRTARLLQLSALARVTERGEARAFQRPTIEASLSA
jgi:hypothetical protein